MFRWPLPGDGSSLKLVNRCQNPNDHCWYKHPHHDQKRQRLAYGRMGTKTGVSAWDTGRTGGWQVHGKWGCRGPLGSNGGKWVASLGPWVKEAPMHGLVNQEGFHATSCCGRRAKLKGVVKDAGTFTYVIG
jgi:hypothetical protein